MKDFYIEDKIYYHDTDCGGVVYYANYLKHLEEARTEYFSSRGIDLKKLANKNIWFVVSKVEINYKIPAKYQDIIKLYVKVNNIKSASIEFYQEIKRENILLVQSKTILVCVGTDSKPIAIPEEIKRSLSS